MKILVLSNLYPPDFIGGYELGCRQVSDALRGRGHEVLVLTSAPRLPIADTEGSPGNRLLTQLGSPPGCLRSSAPGCLRSSARWGRPPGRFRRLFCPGQPLLPAAPGPGRLWAGFLFLLPLRG